MSQEIVDASGTRYVDIRTIWDGRRLQQPLCRRCGRPMEPADFYLGLTVEDFRCVDTCGEGVRVTLGSWTYPMCSEWLPRRVSNPPDA